MTEYTRFRNKNRGYMKLRVWHKAVELYRLVCRIVYTDNKIDFKLRAQIADAAQSVSSNISEGYSWKVWRKREMKALGSHTQRKTLMIIIHKKPNNPPIQ